MSTYTSFINHNFGGISRKDSRFSEELITCSDCQNVELYFTALNSGVGIRTTKGNTSVTTWGIEFERNVIPVGEKVVGMFESHQDGKDYFLIYTESEIEGKIYNFERRKEDFPPKLTLIKDGLTKTGNACATDFVQGYYDMFVFSNGINLVYIYSDTETHSKLVVESPEHLHLTDPLNRPVLGLGMYIFDNRLFIFNGKILWYSKQLECRDFHTSGPDDVTSAGYIEYVKPITAIYPYLDSLAVFHSDSSSLLDVDSSKGKFVKSEESPGGCASYNSLVFHGTDLFFYDNEKKGVFSFKQIVNGDKTLGDNIAYDIQEELIKISPSDLHKIRSLSVVTKDRNEVWMLLPIEEDPKHSCIMIFDYIRGFWVKRKCQKIESIATVDSTLYSGGEHIFQEYETNTFNGEYIPHFYTCTIFNLGADNTMKITKFPPRITVDDAIRTHFWVSYIKNYDVLKDPKIKELRTKSSSNILIYDNEMEYDKNYRYLLEGIDGIIKLPSATFKSLEIKFYTQKKNEKFDIKNFEFSKIKVKQI